MGSEMCIRDSRHVADGSVWEDLFTAVDAEPHCVHIGDDGHLAIGALLASGGVLAGARVGHKALEHDDPHGLLRLVRVGGKDLGQDEITLDAGKLPGGGRVPSQSGRVTSVETPGFPPSWLAPEPLGLQDKAVGTVRVGFIRVCRGAAAGQCSAVLAVTQRAIRGAALSQRESG